jgi:predicted CopG family antitoxin
MVEITTIQIRNETRELLKHMGRKDQTYDDLINELILIKEKHVTDI